MPNHYKRRKGPAKGPLKLQTATLDEHLTKRCAESAESSSAPVRSILVLSV